ncbi:MAG: ATP phosphoribosyltransferase regulatory subunit [Lachnospiraceae bacterium]|nr:ATP phosphoribosyltransferase regulatory subunit [Lachnospiraceae bacterium]
MLKELIHTPEGVRDIYGDEERNKLKVKSLIRNTINLYGYEDIETPTFEYFDVFSKEIGTTPSRELYKFFDREGDTLVLRPDFTPSIARCVAKYYGEETDPIKLTYCGNTFVNNSGLKGKLKESTQIGVELMNDSSAMADAESINLVIESLKSAGLSDFQISLGHMEYFKGLCDNAGIEEENELLLREYVSHKNFIPATELLDSLNCDEKSKELLLLSGESIGDYSVIESALKKINNERSKNALLRLTEVYEILKVFGNEKYVSFDLGMLSKYNYYTGVIFKAYTYGSGDAVAKGGRYDTLVSSFGSSKPAVGFVILIDDLLMALERNHRLPERHQGPVLLKYDAGNYKEMIGQAEKLRKEGTAVSLVPLR